MNYSIDWDGPGERERVPMTGACDVCNAQQVEIRRAVVCGIETAACAKCCGDEEESCPGHIASDGDPKVCGHCGLHIDSMRPEDDQP